MVMSDDDFGAEVFGKRDKNRQQGEENLSSSSAIVEAFYASELDF